MLDPNLDFLGQLYNEYEIAIVQYNIADNHICNVTSQMLLIFFAEYFFTTKDDMKRGIDSGEFIEWAEYSANLYGTRYNGQFTTVYANCSRSV